MYYFYERGEEKWRPSFFPKTGSVFGGGGLIISNAQRSRRRRHPSSFCDRAVLPSLSHFEVRTRLGTEKGNKDW